MRAARKAPGRRPGLCGRADPGHTRPRPPPGIVLGAFPTVSGPPVIFHNALDDLRLRRIRGKGGGGGRHEREVAGGRIGSGSGGGVRGGGDRSRRWRARYRGNVPASLLRCLGGAPFRRCRWRGCRHGPGLKPPHCRHRPHEAHREPRTPPRPGRSRRRMPLSRLRVPLHRGASRDPMECWRRDLSRELRPPLPPPSSAPQTRILIRLCGSGVAGARGQPRRRLGSGRRENRSLSPADGRRRKPAR
ncbi:hypothetical protein BH23GEM11_BH23GEM11_01690 [soil metagenome]